MLLVLELTFFLERVFGLKNTHISFLNIFEGLQHKKIFHCLIFDTFKANLKFIQNMMCMFSFLSD